MIVCHASKLDQSLIRDQSSSDSVTRWAEDKFQTGWAKLILGSEENLSGICSLGSQDLIFPHSGLG
jgi:hypothetical protein